MSMGRRSRLEAARPGDRQPHPRQVVDGSDLVRTAPRSREVERASYAGGRNRGRLL